MKIIKENKEEVFIKETKVIELDLDEIKEALTIYCKSKLHIDNLFIFKRLANIHYRSNMNNFDDMYEGTSMVIELIKESK